MRKYVLKSCYVVIFCRVYEVVNVVRKFIFEVWCEKIICKLKEDILFGVYVVVFRVIEFKNF